MAKVKKCECIRANCQEEDADYSFYLFCVLLNKYRKKIDKRLYQIYGGNFDHFTNYGTCRQYYDNYIKTYYYLNFMKDHTGKETEAEVILRYLNDKLF